MKIDILTHGQKFFTMKPIISNFNPLISTFEDFSKFLQWHFRTFHSLLCSMSIKKTSKFLRALPLYLTSPLSYCVIVEKFYL